MNITALVPILNRPERVATLKADFEASIKPDDDAGLLFICDADDSASIAACEAAGALYILDSSYSPTYASKINLAYQRTTDDWLLTGADDLHFHSGWLEALDDASSSYPEACVLGTNDLHNESVLRGIHSTHTAVKRSYVDEQGAAWLEPGSVLHNGYRHNWCDNELCELAQARGLYLHVDSCHIEHLHPNYSPVPMDSTYELGQRHFALDAELFQSRKQEWSQFF